MSTGRPPTVGIVGAGQLARMAAPAAAALAIPLRVLAAAADEPAALVHPDVHLGSARCAPDLAAFAATVDVVTFEHELVDLPALRALEAAGVAVRPGTVTLAVAVDKLDQRKRLSRLGLPVPPWRRVASLDDVERFAAEHGWPLVLKASTGGYDGRGVWEVTDAGGAAEALRAGADLAEPRLRLDGELAVLVARRPGGEVLAYPPVATVQVNGQCREVVVPAPLPPALAEEALTLGSTVAEAVGAVGVLAVELFVVDGRLLVNELAARPHNAGHWSIEGAATSQFENHLRAVCDLPLGATDQVAPAVAMVNVIGDDPPLEPSEHLAGALAVPGAHVHLYGKVPRPGRKLGHVTALGDDPGEVLGRARRAAAALGGAA